MQVMDKSCHSSVEESSAANVESSKDEYLKQIHRLSHKISKTPIRKHPFDHHQIHHLIPDESHPPQHQPPVYNVSKSDFRDVVQKLTGSPAHEHTLPPPVKPQSSRLQKIRPPPLQNILNRPTPVSPPSNPNFPPGPGNFFTSQRPLSPLPPLPAVHAAAESPISAYMRCFQTNISGVTVTQPPPPPMLSPRFPFSPTNQFGFQQLTPLSPTPPAPSPRWKSL